MPVTKKTACASCFFSTSRTRGVQVGSGPSSKVRTSRWSGTLRLSVRPARVSMTGPPSRIFSGTSVVAAGGWTRWSARISLCT